ncbi:MAG: group II intron reverse transcriptase/maturase, partial [Proteobacteria bacterium]|nr:group II intron reverse transcriptase/maturase [Pseudomonadota bacterium]
MFEANLAPNLDSLMRKLKSGTFVPRPLRRVNVPKGGGKSRPLGIPIVRDRIAQEVIRRLLEPIFEPKFHWDSYGFRPGRNCHKAVERVLELHRQGYKHVLDADIKGFFDNIPHAVIMEQVSNVIADGKILSLIGKFLSAGVMEDGVFKPTTVGTPQGGVISPLLANIVLNVLDWQMHNLGLRFSRYADDFVVLCRSASQAQEALTRIESILTDQLGLELSPEKTKVSKFTERFQFLGFEIGSWSVKMRAKSVEKFKNKVREITKRSRNLDADLISRLNRVVRGTAQYFATPFSRCVTQLRLLDCWIRMRLRCIKFNRKWVTDNRRLRNKHLRRIGLLYLTDFVRAPAKAG